MRQTIRALLLAVAGLPSAAMAQGASSELSCTVAGGFGYVVAGSRPMNCVYYRPDGVVEFYAGTANRLGVDIGPSMAVTTLYRVSTASRASGVLEGTFGGAGFGVTLGEGFGADSLVGGANGGVVLVPIKNAKQLGLNISAGLGAFQLRYVGSEGGVRGRY